MEKKISIILCTYNEVDYIDHTITLISETLDDVEIIVVDDTSTDNSPQLVEDLVKEYPNTLKLLYL